MTAVEEYWAANLDDEATRRQDQASFHVFAEGQHSDVRGQLYNLAAGASLALPRDSWPDHVFLVIGVKGRLRVTVARAEIDMRPLSQVVVLPRVRCTVTSITDASIELVSFLSSPPRSPDLVSLPGAEKPTTLSAAGNVLVPAILVLEARGFTITRHVRGTEESWRAERGKLELVGADPIELLALASLFESKGAEWRAPDPVLVETMRRFDLG